MSPLLKLFAPCLNSHRGCSGLPLWNTSLTVDQLACLSPGPEVPQQDLPLWNPYILSWRTKEEMLVCLKYCLPSCALAKVALQQQQVVNVRKHFGEFVVGSHNEALLVLRPGYQVLYGFVFEHT